MARIRVDTDASGQRVDHLVAVALPGLSVAAARRLITNGAVRVDGRLARKGEHLTAGQTVEVDEAGVALPGAEALRVRPDPQLAIAIVQIDPAFVAIEKPAGVPSHPMAAGELGTAANAIVARFPECAAASPDPREGGLVHRLDTGTSGVLLAARSPTVWPRLRAALSSSGCEKTYLAEVRGAPPDAGVASAPIGRVGRRGARVRVDGGRNPLPAHTTWEVIARRRDTTLVRVRLHKGRAHQVRAHLAAAGYPIVGDSLYGGGAGDPLHLHAESVRFPHPDSGALILIESPPPTWAKLGE
ncbi:MAG TPA: RluA family pseudouridine synthase [Polyangia bacterium]